MGLFRRFFSYYRPHMGLFMLDTVVAIISSLLSVLFPLLTNYLLRGPVAEKDVGGMVLIFLVMLCVYIFQACSTYIRIRWGHFLGVRIENEMRQDLFDHLQGLSFSYFDKTKTGSIMSRITNDLFQIAEIAHHGPEDFIISILTIVTSYIFMFSISVPLAMISFIPLPLMLLYGIFFGHRLKVKNREVRKTIADVNVDAENSIQGIREVKSFAQEDFQKKKFNRSNTKLKESREGMYIQMANYQTGIGFMRELYYLVTVIGGAVLIYFDLSDVSTLITFTLFVSVVLSPVDRLINFTEQLQQGIASFERFTEVMDTEPSIKDVPGAEEICVRNGDVEFSDVSFSYEGDDGKVLDHLDLSIRGGENVALVGESGAGKTTIVNLLSRFYEPTGGKILIDGIDISLVTQSSLHKAIGFVQQNVFLFDASIRENLRYGKGNASDEELWEALRMANLYDFVSSLPQGLDTEVGERGARLSGGQRQRLSIARVFLKNPPIIVFDEATSSLDTESEASIQEAFSRVAKGRTAIVIAHRLSTIVGSDKIFVLENGCIVEEGDHETLLKKSGTYSRLYSRKCDSL